MPHIIFTKTEATALFREERRACLYIAGAGKYGDILGEFLNKKGYSWCGYIDKNSTGSLNGKPIIGYDDEKIPKESMFIISSEKYADEIAQQLQQNGIEDCQIYVFLTYLIIFDLYEEVNSLMQMVRENIYTSHSYGEKDPDKIYMVMEKTNGEYAGLMCDFCYFLAGIRYADQMGFIPVIDRKNHPSVVTQDIGMRGKENSWDYYFKQPGGVSLDYVVSGCKNIRRYNMDNELARRFVYPPVPTWIDSDYKDRGIYHKIAKKYIHPSDAMKKRIDHELTELFPYGEKVVGVIVREEFLFNQNRRYVSVNKQPSIETLIHDVRIKMQEWNYKYIFLVCMTEDIIKAFRNAFGDSLIVTNRNRCSIEDFIKNANHDLSEFFDTVPNRVNSNKDYMVEIYGLTKCDALISGANGACYGALLLKDGDYEHIVTYYMDFAKFRSVC